MPRSPEARDAEDEVLTIQESAVWLRISQRHLERLLADGKLRAIGLGRSKRIMKSELVRYMRGDAA